MQKQSSEKDPINVRLCRNRTETGRRAEARPPLRQTRILSYILVLYSEKLSSPPAHPFPSSSCSSSSWSPCANSLTCSWILKVGQLKSGSDAKFSVYVSPVPYIPPEPYHTIPYLILSFEHSNSHIAIDSGSFYRFLASHILLISTIPIKFKYSELSSELSSCSSKLLENVLSFNLGAPCSVPNRDKHLIQQQ